MSPIFKLSAKYFQLPKSIFIKLTNWAHSRWSFFIPKSFMTVIVKQFIKSHFYKVVSEGYKLKEWCIKENYHFRTKRFSLFLSWVAIYMKNFSVTGIEVNKFTFPQHLFIKSVQLTIKTEWKTFHNYLNN